MDILFDHETVMFNTQIVLSLFFNERFTVVPQVITHAKARCSTRIELS